MFRVHVILLFKKWLSAGAGAASEVLVPLPSSSSGAIRAAARAAPSDSTGR